jgi:SAM-dependent methyltransferase
MAEYNYFYQKAMYYDIVFHRDVSREIDFIREVYRQLVGGEAAALLDLACGPGYHARDFAKRGFRAVGLDLRTEMIGFAQQCAEQEGVSVDWIAADMRYVELDQPVDVVINMFDGIDCLNHNDDIIAHLRAMAGNMTPGGLYFMDVTHPRDLGYGGYTMPFIYRGERDGVKVEIEWATNNPQIDPVNSTYLTEVTMRVNDHGEEIVTVDTACERILTGQEIVMLCELSGALKPVAWYGDFNIEQPLDSSPQSRRMITVLQKR